MSFRRRLLELITHTSGGDPIPAGVEIGLFTPTENETTHTITHSLGEVPKMAYCFAVINGAWTSLPSATIAVNEFISDPGSGVFDPTLTGAHKRDNVIQPSSDTLLGTTYPASMDSQQVTFATGRYYSGRFTQGTQYIYILIK